MDARLRVRRLRRPAAIVTDDLAMRVMAGASLTAVLAMAITL